MTHVVTQPCVGCRYTDCVVVCPVECFYEGEKMLYIHPDECIDCEACVAECPVEAIFHEDNVPGDWKSYIELNAEMQHPNGFAIANINTTALSAGIYHLQAITANNTTYTTRFVKQ